MGPSRVVYPPERKCEQKVPYADFKTSHPTAEETDAVNLIFVFKSFRFQKFLTKQMSAKVHEKDALTLSPTPKVATLRDWRWRAKTSNINRQNQRISVISSAVW